MRRDGAPPRSHEQDSNILLVVTLQNYDKS